LSGSLGVALVWVSTGALTLWRTGLDLQVELSRARQDLRIARQGPSADDALQRYVTKTPQGERSLTLALDSLTPLVQDLARCGLYGSAGGPEPARVECSLRLLNPGGLPAEAAARIVLLDAGGRWVGETELGGAASGDAWLAPGEMRAYRFAVEPSGGGEPVWFAVLSSHRSDPVHPGAGPALDPIPDASPAPISGPAEVRSADPLALSQG
jgi:hypothetical protein